jgi:hypothetical protein
LFTVAQFLFRAFHDRSNDRSIFEQPDRFSLRARQVARFSIHRCRKRKKGKKKERKKKETSVSKMKQGAMKMQSHLDRPHAIAISTFCVSERIARAGVVPAECIISNKDYITTITSGR